MSACTGCGGSQGSCSALQARGKRGIYRCCTECSHHDAKPTHTPAAERAAVVRYLRAEAAGADREYRLPLYDAADAIERGAHLKEPAT